MIADGRPTIALVLGGTSGLGRASAEALAAGGSEVLLSGRSLAEAVRVAAEIAPQVRGIEVDLTNSESVAKLCSLIGRTHIGQLVLNSGGPPPASVRQIDAEAVRTALDYLLLAHIDIVNAALPRMVEAQWGRIVAIGSSGVQQPIPGLALSNIGRAALAAYLKGLAAEVARFGVTVNMVLPGRIDTDRVASLDANSAALSGESTEAVRTRSEERIPAGRYGTSAEFASAVAFLCSDSAAFITGEQLRVDGGMVQSY